MRMTAPFVGSFPTRRFRTMPSGVPAVITTSFERVARRLPSTRWSTSSVRRIMTSRVYRTRTLGGSESRAPAEASPLDRDVAARGSREVDLLDAEPLDALAEEPG